MPNFLTGVLRSPIPWLFVGLRGRISRRTYWLSYFVLLCVNAALIGQLFGGAEASYFRFAQAVGPFVILATVFSNIAIAVKRLHDVGYSGFLAVALFVPLVNVAFTIWVGLLPGTADTNAYGDVPDIPPP